MRTFLAGLIGLLVGVGGIQLLEYLGFGLYNLGEIEGFNPTTKEEARQIVYYMPVLALVFVIFAHGIGLIVGFMTARLIDRSSLTPLFIIAGLLMLSALINVILLPHPLWFVIADIGLIMILSFLFIATRRKA